MYSYILHWLQRYLLTYLQKYKFCELIPDTYDIISTLRHADSIYGYDIGRMVGMIERMLHMRVKI